MRRSESGARQVRFEPAENVGELLAGHVREGHELFCHSVDDTGVLGLRCVRKRRLAHPEFAHGFCDMRGPGVPRVVTSVTSASGNDRFRMAFSRERGQPGWHARTVPTSDAPERTTRPAENR